MLPHGNAEGAEGVREFKVGRIKRSADPAPNSDSAPIKNHRRIGVAALLDAGLQGMPASPCTEVPDALKHGIQSYLEKIASDGFVDYGLNRSSTASQRDLSTPSIWFPVSFSHLWCSAMMYFIPWVIFLLVVILAVPVAAHLEKRKRQAALGPLNEEIEEEAAEASAAEEGEFTEESAEAVEFEADEVAPGDDDLAEFEELRE